MNENREYKSDVFSMLMEDKRYALEVYNALNGSDYTDPGSMCWRSFSEAERMR